MSVDVPRLRFTVKQYHRMGETGVLPRNARVELLDGEIIEMTPIGSRHAACVSRNHERFVLNFHGRAIVQGQNPVILSDYSEPEPDLALLRFREDFYARELPRAADGLLAVEVGDTTADLDRTLKLPLYAKAKIVELWLINLLEDCIEVYRDPKRGRYAWTNRFNRGERVSCSAFPDVSWTVDEILGEP